MSNASNSPMLNVCLQPDITASSRLHGALPSAQKYPSVVNLHKTLNTSSSSSSGSSGILKAKIMKNGKVSNGNSTVSAKVNDYRKVRNFLLQNNLLNLIDLLRKFHFR